MLRAFGRERADAMRVTTGDGRVFDGTAEQIIEEMRDMDFAPSANVDEYMERAARRAGVLRDAGTEGVGTVRPWRGATEAERCDAFLRALADAGLVTITHDRRAD